MDTSAGSSVRTGFVNIAGVISLVNQQHTLSIVCTVYQLKCTQNRYLSRSIVRTDTNAGSWASRGTDAVAPTCPCFSDKILGSEDWIIDP